jgi:metal-responsive CopG/Arc/MetJ family transcriptional regulator
MESEYSESVIVNLGPHMLEAIDKIREEWGMRSRADIIERILEEVLAPDSSNCQPQDPSSPQDLHDAD